MAKDQLHWVYGIHAAQTLLKSRPEQVAEIRVTKGRNDQRLTKIQQLAEKHGIACTQVSKSALQQLFPDQTDANLQDVAVLCAQHQLYDERFLEKLLSDISTPLLLVLDGVTDPHNLGACLRSADAAGVHAVIVPKDRSAGITPVVSKVACGAAETMPFVVVTNLARTLRMLQQQGVWIVGTAGEAEQSLYQSNLNGPLALVMGAEEKGLRRLTREHCDLLVKLPMAGSVSSLNVSVATGVCLFEVVRQRGG